jgi:hypothetical protein
VKEPSPFNILTNCGPMIDEAESPQGEYKCCVTVTSLAICQSNTEQKAQKPALHCTALDKR